MDLQDSGVLERPRSKHAQTWDTDEKTVRQGFSPLPRHKLDIHRYNGDGNGPYCVYEITPSEFDPRNEVKPNSLII